jgi:hypothetical protein
MALFKVNTGCREGEVCRLRWDWEVKVPELETSVFIVPNAYVKNGEDRKGKVPKHLALQSTAEQRFLRPLVDPPEIIAGTGPMPAATIWSSMHHRWFAVVPIRKRAIGPLPCAR